MSAEPGFQRIHLHISGRVQGVAYRAYAQDEAEALGLKGWVRNLRDGQVELVAEGPSEALERLAAWCRRGPPAARVHEVRTEWGAATGEFTVFSINR